MLTLCCSLFILVLVLVPKVQCEHLDKTLKAKEKQILQLTEQVPLFYEYAFSATVLSEPIETHIPRHHVRHVHISIAPLSLTHH